MYMYKRQQRKGDRLLTGTGWSGFALRGVWSSGSSGMGNARAPEALRVVRTQRTTPHTVKNKTPHTSSMATSATISVVRRETADKKTN